MILRNNHQTMKNTAFVFHLPWIVMSLFMANPASSELIADGVECYSYNDLQVNHPLPCDDSKRSVHVLTVDLKIAKVFPVVGRKIREQFVGDPNSSPGGHYPKFERKIARDLVYDRSRPPVEAIAAVNGGFFPHTDWPAFTYSEIIDVDGKHWKIPPWTMNSVPKKYRGLTQAQHCRSERRSILRLQLRNTIQIPSFESEQGDVKYNWPNDRDKITVLGGGGRLLPTQASPNHRKCFGERGHPDPGWNKKRPRTGIGYDRKQSPSKLFIVAVTKKIDIMELRQFMHSLGATDAIALDGGGSTQMWIRKKNNYNVGGFRSIVSALVVYAEPLNLLKVTKGKLVPSKNTP